MTRSEKTGENLFPVDPPSDPETVLVGVVRRRSDLDRALREGWYRIPGGVRFRRRPRYLALYPVKRCGRGGGMISWYAPVAGIACFRRDELLPDEPDHPRAGEKYWKITLGERKKLARPVRNRLRRRVVFAYTTLSRLRRAREIGELFDIPPLEEIARRALADAGIEAREQFIVRKGKRCRYRIDFAIFCRQGKIALECDHSRWHQQPARKRQDRRRDRRLEQLGWTPIHLPEDEILLQPLAMIPPLRRLIESLGGPVEKEVKSGEPPGGKSAARNIPPC